MGEMADHLLDQDPWDEVVVPVRPRLYADRALSSEIEQELEDPEAIPRQIFDEPGYRPYRAAPAYAHREVELDRKAKIRGAIVMAVIALLIAVVAPTFDSWWLSR